MKWTIINCTISNWIMWILIIGPSAVTGKVVWTWAVCQSIRKLDFQGKILYGKKWSKWLIKGNFQLFENLCHQFFLKMVLNRLFSISPYANLMSWEVLFLESWYQLTPNQSDCRILWRNISWLSDWVSVFGLLPLGEEGYYDLATVSMSIGKHVNGS